MFSLLRRPGQKERKMPIIARGRRPCVRSVAIHARENDPDPNTMWSSLNPKYEYLGIYLTTNKPGSISQSGTVCPKVAYNSFHMVFSAISGWILKPFDLQVATMCGFDIMYDKPVLPSKVPQCKWITFRHDLEKIKFSVNLTSTVWRFCRPW